MSARYFSFLTLTLCAALVVGGTISAQEPEPKLPGILKRAPSRSNTVVYINPPALSKLMRDAGMTDGLRSNVEEVWAIADLDLDSLRPKWEVGYAKLGSPVDAAALAAGMKGYVDSVSGREVVRTSMESYLIPLEDQRLGFMRPADRSMLATWADESSGGARVSEFLQKQAVRPESYLSFMLAVDVANRFSPVGLEDRISTLGVMQGQDAKKMAEIMASVKGISIIVGRRSLSECILALEHSKSPEALLPIANKLLVEILERNGTSAPEVATWKASVKGNTLQFQGPISESSLDGVLGILSLQGHASQIADATAKSELREENLAAYKSKQYFDKVNAYIERVRKYKAQTTGFRAKWNETQARRIEELNTLDVDPELVDYGFAVAQMLRGNAVSIQKGNVAAGQLQASPSNGYGGEYYNYGGYGGGYYGNGYNAYSRARDQASVGARQRMGAYGSYKEAIAAIDELTAQTRRSMTSKFGINF
ncbi:MAG: hypothetical protein ACE361_00605 [Aureliella sp.]